MRRLRVIPFGTSSGVPTRTRMVSAVAVDFESRWILLDCGEGTQLRLLEAPLRPSRLEAIFITHLHGDHLFGLPGLLSSFSIVGREEPLHVYGPPGIKKYLDVTASPPHTRIAYQLAVTEIQPGLVCESDHYRVSCLHLNHVIEDFGFRIEEERSPHRTIAYCTDTKPTDNAVELARDSDLLIHESTFLRNMDRRAGETGHSTAIDAAKVACRAGCGKLLLTHFSPRYKELDKLVQEARNHFRNTDAAEDLKELEVRPREERSQKSA